MKFWKLLRWITSVLLVIIFVAALAMNYRGSTSDEQLETSAPKFH